MLGYKTKERSELEQILISPDSAANFRGAQSFGLISEGDGEQVEAQYKEAISLLKNKEIERVLFVGREPVVAEDLNAELLAGIAASEVSLGIFYDMEHPLFSVCQSVLPGRSYLEKSGLMINRAGRIQYLDRVMDPHPASKSEWWWFDSLSQQKASSSIADREATRAMLEQEPIFEGLSIATIKKGGVDLGEHLSKIRSSGSSESHNQEGGAPA